MYLFLLVKFQSYHYPGEAAMDEEDDMDFDGLEDDEDDDDDDDESSRRPGMLARRYWIVVMKFSVNFKWQLINFISNLWIVGVIALPGGGFSQEPKVPGEGEQPECKQN